MGNASNTPDITWLWDMNAPSAAAEKFRAALPEARARADQAYLVELLTQLARAEGLQGHFDVAHAVLDEANGLLGEGASRARVRYLLERGRMFNSSGKQEAARPCFQEAWELAERTGDEYLAVDAAHMMAIVAAGDQRLNWNLRGLEIAQASTDETTKTWLGPLYNNLGWEFHDLGRFETALDYFRRGLVWRQQRGQVRETRIAAWAVARALRSLCRFDEALALQKDNLRAANAAGEPGGFVLEELGELLLAKDDPAAARDYFAQAYRYLSSDSWLVAHEPDRLERLRRLGGVASDVKT